METYQLKEIRAALEEKGFDINAECKWKITGIPAAGPSNPLQSKNRLRFRFEQVVRLIATDNKAQRNLSDAEEQVLARWFTKLRDAVRDTTQSLDVAPR